MNQIMINLRENCKKLQKKPRYPNIYIFIFASDIQNNNIRVDSVAVLKKINTGFNYQRS